MAIDEKKLKDDIWKYALTCKNTSFEFARRMSDIEKIIDEQPKLSLEKFQAISDKTSDWVPCSERLPKKSGWYYVTLESRFDGHRCTDWVSYYHGWSYASGDVVAWKEHSEPYKGE